MTRSQWRKALKAAPPKLTLTQLSKHLSRPYYLVQIRAKEFGYKPTDDRAWTLQRRREFQRVPWAMVYWWQSNSEIARIWGVSREIVRRRRKEYANGNRPH